MSDTDTVDLKTEYLHAGAALGKAIEPLAMAGLVLTPIADLPRQCKEDFLQIHELLNNLITDLYRAAGLPVGGTA